MLDRVKQTSTTITEQTPEDSVLVCCECHHRITSRHQAHDIDGQTEQGFMNPAGFSFRVICFNRADGCRVSGKATAEHSWFTGYAWQYALCMRCGQHLGWYYQSRDDAFFGLIKARLGVRS